MATIAVIEDEAAIVRFLERGLVAEGHVVLVAADGVTGLTLGRRDEVDLVVLDLGLPRLDGTDVLVELRRHRPEVPVIVLTARDAVADRVSALDAGADDYVIKPFSLSELLARIRARLRPREQAAAWRVEAGGIALDLRSREATVDGRTRALSAREFALLEVLLRHPGHVLSQAQLLDQVWGYDFDGGSNVVEVYIRHLRTKLGRDRIETVRGAGYRIPRDP